MAILFKKAGHIVPLQAVELIAGNNRTTFSMAAIDSDGVMQIEPGKGEVPVNEIMAAFEAFKERDMLLHFGNTRDPVDEDIQPYTLLESPKSPLLLGYFEGDFDGMKRQDSSFCGAYFAAQELKSGLLGAFKASKGDLAAVVAMLKEDKDWEDELAKMYAKEGNITLFAQSGDILSFNTLSTHTRDEFTWGWATNAYGYKAVAPVITPAKGGMFSKFKMSVPSTKVNKIEPQPEPAPAETPIDKPDVTKDKPSEVHQDIPNALMKIDQGISYLRADPKRCRSNADKEAVYAYCVEKPKNFKDCPWVQMKKPGVPVIKSFSDLKKKIDEKGGDAAAVAAADPKGGNVTEFKKFAEKKSDPVADQIAEQNRRGLINATQKKNIEDYLAAGIVKKAIDHHNKELQENPEEVQKMEAKLPTFAQSLGTNLEETLNWPFSIRWDIAKKEPVFAAVAWKDMTNLYKAALSDIAALEKKVEELEEQLTAPKKEEASTNRFSKLLKKTA